MGAHSQSFEGAISQSPTSNIHKEPLYTYTSWLDDIESDTECQYFCRGRLMPGKINHVQYILEVQTSLGSETFVVKDGKIKPSKKQNEDKEHKDIVMKDKNDDNKMDIDHEQNGKEENAENGLSENEWFRKVKIGDFVLCLNEETNEWDDGKVLFVNRRFDLQYIMRRSTNKEEIYEYDPKTMDINYSLREKMRPSQTVSIQSTPAPPSQTLSPLVTKKKKKRKKKKNRFEDSDDSTSEHTDSEEDEMNESESRTTSVSPIDDLQTKIETILFRLKLPRNTVKWRDTFKHLINTNTTNSKQEQDAEMDDIEMDKKDEDNKE